MRKISRAARPHTVTVYNYQGTTAGVATYQRTQLARVCYDGAHQQKLAKRGVTTQDKAQLTIELRDLDATANRTYVLPKTWANLTPAQRAPYFTFDTANDFFVEGACSTELPPATKAKLQKTERIIGVTEVSLTGFILEVYGK